MSESNTTLIAAIIGAVIGGLIALCGSIVPIFISERRKHAELEDRSKKDLIAELEQNKRHQATNHFIDLEDSAYKRLRERGFFYKLSTDLQKDLQELYAFIHEKNGLSVYGNSVGIAKLIAQPTLSPEYLSTWDGAQAIALRHIAGIIKSKDDNIMSLIDQILPKLRKLL
jgi:hypothetical protein